MEVYPKILLALGVLLPLIGVVLVYLASRTSVKWGSILTAVVCGVTFFDVSLMYPIISKGHVIEIKLQTGLPVVLSFRVDSLGLLLAFTSSLVWFMASVYAIEYMEPEHAITRFNIFSLFSFFGTMGIVLTGDLFTLYIFFEIMAVLAYMLVIHEETLEAMRAGLKYLFMSIIGGLVLLMTIVATFVITGSIGLAGKGLAALQHSPYFLLVFWSYIFGFGIKAGMFPVHVWLPDAHPIAPSPASALLSGVMIKVGAYGIIRTVYAIFGFEMLSKGFDTAKILMALGIVSIILGSAVAITEKEIKRLLAYSSIANMGYIVLGTSLISPRGLVGGIIHIYFHSLMKGCLFLCAGAIIFKTGLRQIDDFRGIGRRMPITMACFCMAAASMIGFPPFCGFLSKWTLALGALDSANRGFISAGWATTGVIGTLILSSLMNAIYYGPIMIKAWFGEEGAHGAHEHNEHKEVKREDPSWIMLGPIVILAVGCLVFGLFPKIPMGLAELTVKHYNPPWYWYIINLRR
jgi:multicomponent Na+:H+ antiporter subunit D